MMEILKKIHNWNEVSLYWTDDKLYIEAKHSYNSITYDCDLINAYIIYKALENAKEFDWCANNSEIIELGNYISKNAQLDSIHECDINMSLIDEINRRMKIVGCPNFINKDNRRMIVNYSIDTHFSNGLMTGFNKVIKKLVQERKQEIPKILTDIDTEYFWYKYTEEFVRKLRMITEYNEEYKVINNKLYKYISNIN
jgi:hypothetical protein